MTLITDNFLPDLTGRLLKRSAVAVALLTTVLLTGCGADISDETAMPEVDELALEQCEVPQYGIIGTPTDPVTVDGVEIRACLVNKNFAQIVNSTNIYGNLNAVSASKNSWHYEDLVWVLDGTYEIGNNQTYDTLTALIADRNNYSITAYAKPGTVIIVHRNARLNGTIYSLDDNNVGGGEWGGVIVNGIGYSADCPDDSSADNFCNVKGPFGYYGGVGLDDDVSAYGLDVQAGDKLGLPGLYSRGNGGALVAEAGEEVSVTLEGFDGGTINAAVTAYAPLQQQTGGLIVYSGGKSLVIYDGSSNDTINASGYSPMLMVQQAAASSVELNDYHGNLNVVVNQNASSDSAVRINGGQVNLHNSTLLDQFNSAGNAVEISGAASVNINSVVIQGFNACLQVQDAASSISSVSTTLFNCSTSTAAADSGTDYAAGAVASATDFVEGIDPELLPTWIPGNESLSFSGVDDIFYLGAATSYNGKYGGQYVVAIQYPQCMGVGSLSDTTLSIDGTLYQLCDLDSAIDSSVTLYSYFSTQGALSGSGSADYSAKYTAWRVNGQVMVGSDFPALSAAEQTAALADPIKFNFSTTTRLVAAANSDAELIIQPDVSFKARGSSVAPLVISGQNSGAGEITSTWRGITINGSDALPEDNTQVDIQYLRLFDTGEDGQAALTLNNVGAGSDIAYLDIYGAGGDGLNITGGAVNVDNLVMANIAGDQIAWSNGYTGTIETAVISPGDSSTGSVLHGVNDSTDYDASPRSRPVLSNITAAGFGSDNTAILLEQGTGLLLFNSVFSEFATCLDIDDAETAALLNSDPLGIVFDGVVLDCDSTLAAENEDSGYDYGYDVANSSGVYEEEAVLDTGYVVTGAETATSTDLSSYADLIGDAYNYLKGDGYIGAVADSDDDWYANWSDSVVIAPDAGCDDVGVLTDLVSYTYDSVTTNTQFTYHGTAYYPAAKYCRILGGTYTEDITLGEFSGAAREAYDARIAAGDSDSDARLNSLTSGWAINASTGEEVYIEDAVMELAPTHWTIKGVVHIGNGNQEITDTDTVADMKANPVTFTIEPGIELTPETDSSVLHITRAGALSISGEPEYLDLSDTPAGSRGLQTSQFKLVIDGFGRHNQCPDAAAAAAGSQVCNIEGKYGYYGGYDNDYVNFSIDYMKLNKPLRLNAVGSGLINNLLLAVTNTDIPDEYIGTDYIVIDGGSPVLKNLFYTSSFNYFAGLIHWNHGYQGTIQYASFFDHWRTVDDRLFMAEDTSRFYSPLRGENVTDEERDVAGSADALPRSAPTIANVSLVFREFGPYDETSSAVDLSNGSGLYLYNSVFGTKSVYASNDVDLCFYIDDTIKDQLGDTLIINNLAYSCTEFSNDPDSSTYLIDQIAASSTSNTNNYGYVFATNGPDDYDGGVVDGVNIMSGLNQLFALYPARAIILGDDSAWGTSDDDWIPDYSTSSTINNDHIENNSYMGAFDYSLVLDAGETISD